MTKFNSRRLASHDIPMQREIVIGTISEDETLTTTTLSSRPAAWQGRGSGQPRASSDSVKVFVLSPTTRCAESSIFPRNSTITQCLTTGKRSFDCEIIECSSLPVAHLVSALLWQRDSAVPWLRSFRVPTSDTPVFSSPFNLLTPPTQLSPIEKRTRE